MKFTPMYDLESLTEDQRKLYYLSACEYFKVPPELNLLAFFYMDSGEGKRNLVLYAKKGATDIIRGNLQISTISLEQANGPGYVSWVVKGQDKTGRVEQAVGSASIEGLRGQALASQVMIAQTRATRRMTLQFVGGGLLDESELHGVLTDINRADSPLATLSTIPAPIQPTVKPNTDPGKDITPKTEEAVAIMQYGTLRPDSERKRGFDVPQNPPKEGVSLQTTAPAAFSSGDITPASVETTEQVKEPKKRRGRPRKNSNEVTFDEEFGTPHLSEYVRVEQPKAPETGYPAKYPDTMSGYDNNPGKVSESGHNKTEAPESRQPIQTRPFPPAFGPEGKITGIDVVVTPKEMNMPTAESAQKALQEVASKLDINKMPAPTFLRDVPVIVGNALIDSVVKQAAAELMPVVDPDMPSEAEEKAWRARLFVYTNDVLPKGGMRKEDGIIWKIRKYVQLMFPDLPVKNGTVKLNNKQWKHLMGILDGNQQTQGPAGLVKIIEDATGKT